MSGPVARLNAALEGCYAIERELSEGGMATVYLADHLRHLPIVDDRRLAGIISIGDVVNAHVEETEFEIRMLKDYVQGRT